MKRFIYFLTVLVFAFVACEKENLESVSPDASGEDALTALHLKQKNSISIVGQNDPTMDIEAVQEAVDEYDHVVLSGTFDFGEDEATGGVEITRPNVIVTGPATILNGAKIMSSPIITLKAPLSIYAPGVEIHELVFNNDFDGILVYTEEDGKPVVISGNTFNVNEFGVALGISVTPGGIKLLNNMISAFYPYFAIQTSGDTEIADNDMQDCFECVFIFGFDHKLDVINNNMSTIPDAFEGMFIGSWRVTTDTGPDWGDNPPVRILDNTIEVEGLYAGGILVGTSAHGINNTLVKGNTISGTAGFSGILKYPYGRNNRIVGNDLSGLTTYGPQLWMLGGRNNHFQNNKLGSVLPLPGPGFIAAQEDAATLVSTVNLHLNDPFNTPDPLNLGNHFSHNDYSDTGVAGWSEDPGSIGAVLLQDFIQRYEANGDPYYEPFAMENYVSEKNFPEGTDLCDQVLDLSGTNHIAGFQACDVAAKKAIHVPASSLNKSLNQRLKDRHAKRMEILEKKNVKLN